MASSSAIPLDEKYDAFISFRGSDTRETFTSHLHAALIRRKIETYIDYRLEKGEELEPALLKAIEESKIYVVIFSEDYASSTWCLKELSYIMECQGRGGRYVIPIFYGIDPSAVRHQKESYETAFAEHEQRLDLDKVLKWKEAVTKAANKSGFDSTSRTFRDDSDLIEQVVKDVLTKLKRNSTSNVPDNLVGVEARIESIVRELDITPNNVRVRLVVIWGMGGIGKTTLADVVFHRLSSEFEACCFLQNVRELSGDNRNSSGSPQLKDLRNKLLTKLLGEKDLDIETPNLESYVQDRLNRKKVLVVLDDVNHSIQLDFLAGGKVPFGPGSRIIITTRDLQPVKEMEGPWEVVGRDVKTYEVKELDGDESMQFFLSSTRRDLPPNSKFLDGVLRYAAGVPLAIKLLSGQFLRCKSPEELELLWKKLRKFPHKKLQDVYRASYDALEENEREIFLDIACFHKGRELHDTKRILAACGLFPDDGIQILNDMSLISIKHRYTWIGDYEYDSIWMHDVIQEMGVDIVREECAEESGNRSRLHNWEDVSYVFKNNMGTAKVRSIHLKTYYGNSSMLTLCPQAFTGMHNLRFLKLRSLKFEDEAYLESLPNALRYLYWSRCPLKSLPSNFCPTNLVEFHMPGSALTRFWVRGQDLKNLKAINLSYSRALVEVGDLSNCVNIETIDLSACRSLVKVLDLSNCEKLKSIVLAKSKSLVEVGDLSKCVNIETIDMRECRSLVKVLDLSNCEKLKSINLGYCTSLVEVGDLSNCENIETIDMSGCRNLVKVSDLSNCKKLKSIDLGYCKCLVEVGDLSNCRKLISINLGYCKCLVEVGDLSNCKKLKSINLGYCKRLVEVGDLSNCENIETIDMSGCRNLVKVSDLSNFKKLKSINLGYCKRLVEVGDLSNFKKLKSINLGYCKRLVEVGDLSNCENIETIDMSGCRNLVKVSDLSNFKKLKSINLGYCTNLVEVGDLSNCENIETIDMSGCRSLVKVSDLSNCRKLLSINLRYCTSLVEVGDLSNCENIVTIDMRECRSLVKVSDLSNCRKLLSINLRYCTSLVEVGDLSNCENIVTIDMRECRSLVKVSDLSNCRKLIIIDLECRSPVEVPDLSKSVSIESLSLTGFSSLVQIPPYIYQFTKLTHLHLAYSEIESVPSSIESLTGLETLHLGSCRRLVSLPTNICKLKSLRELNLSDCGSLREIPNCFDSLLALEKLNLSRTMIQTIPPTIKHVSGLETLDLSDCGSLRDIPNCFDSLLALQQLDLSRTMIQTIPPTIKHVSGLKSLRVDGCKRLRSLPVLPCLLQVLTARECDSLKTVAASVTAHTQGLDQISPWDWDRSEQHDFCLCPSLDGEARRNIMDDAYNRIMRFATARNLGYLSSGGELEVICDHTEIPKWFSCQTEGSSMNIKLPLHWFHSNLLGFALCVVTRTTVIYDLKYKMILKTKDGVGHSMFSTVDFQYEGGMIVWYNEFKAVSDEAKESTEAYFEVYSEEHAVERCGVCFLYPPGQDDNALKFEVIYPQQFKRRRIDDEASASQVPGELESNETDTEFDDSSTESEISGELESNETDTDFDDTDELESDGD